MAEKNIDPPKKTWDFSSQNDPNNPEARVAQPYFVDMVNCETLYLQTIPIELTYEPECQWAAIAAPGRNNPNYQFLGAEDTLSLSITWYANEESREDVLRKCKWLESMSKNNGYDEKPHRVKFMFGNLFNDSEWIITSAKYNLRLFSRPYGMLPALALQEIVLKRIMTTNRTTNQIRKIDT